MLFPTLRKNKKSPLLKKNKTLPTHYPTAKNEMTVLIDYYNGMSLDKKEGQLVTNAKIKRAVSANLKSSATNKLHRRLTVNCSEMPASF
jgi:hypothetical protein